MITLNPRLIAIALGASFSLVTFVLAVLEPELGFETMDDFWNVDLVVPALGSLAWLLGDICHIVNGILLILLATHYADARLVSRFGFAAGVIFIVVAMVDRAATFLPAFVDDPERLATVSLSFVATRMGLLFAAVFLFGGFILTLPWLHPTQAQFPAWFRYASLVVALPAFAFFLMPAPVPPLFALWAFALAFVIRSEGSSPATEQ